jgi:hypothetical protein
VGALTKEESQRVQSGSRNTAYQETVTHKDTPEAEREAAERLDESDSEDEAPASSQRPTKPARKGVSLAVYKVSFTGSN